jgi:tRNA (guanine-N1)-methyltransferase
LTIRTCGQAIASERTWRVRIDIITIFPEYFGPLGVSLIGKATQRGDIVFGVHDLRSWAADAHRTVDDTPFGGGPGMVMKAEPWGAALDAIAGLATAQGPGLVSEPQGLGLVSEPQGTGLVGEPQGTGLVGEPQGTGLVGEPQGTGLVGEPQGTGLVGEPQGLGLVSEPQGTGLVGEPRGPGVTGGPHGRGLAGAPQLVVPTPAGAVFTQAMAAELAGVQHLVFACGRYEGIDARVVEYARTMMAVHEVTIGDYVLAGGEPAVLVMIEAICRLLPGVLGNAESAPDDSFGAGGGPMSGLVEGPAYTRPRAWRGLEVPPVLLSGNHAAIARWRRDHALCRTAQNRPDLAARLPAPTLSARDREVLSEAGFAGTGEDVAH